MKQTNKQTNKQKTEVLMKKLVYLGLSILELSKRLMYDVWALAWLCKTEIW